MGLFGPSKSELEDRIDTLERKVRIAEDTAREAKDDARKAKHDAKRAAQTAEDLVSGMVHTFETLSENGHQFNTVSKAFGCVEELDEPAIAWKATANYIAKLYIPDGATVVHTHGTKKRTNKAVVIAFYDVEKTFDRDPFYDVRKNFDHDLTERNEIEVNDDPTAVAVDSSRYDASFTYRVGETVIPRESLNTNVEKECTNGIHFFRTKEQAAEWL